MRGRVSYLVDISGWAKGGAVLGAHFGKLAEARLAAARAFPSNLIVQVQARVLYDEEEQARATASSHDLARSPLHLPAASPSPQPDLIPISR